MESYSDFIDRATRIAEGDSQHVVSASTFVRAWTMATSDIRPVALGVVVHFDFTAKQAMASASAWADEGGRLVQTEDLMLAVLIQSDPVAMETLVHLGYVATDLRNDLLSQLGYSPESTPSLVALPGVGMIPSLPERLREALRHKVSVVTAEAMAGASWESIWEGCTLWLQEITDEFSLDPVSEGSLSRYLLDESQAIIKRRDPDFVTWSERRQS